MVHSPHELGANGSSAGSKNSGLSLAVFKGEVPVANPWNAAYSNHLSRTRDQGHIVFGKVNRFSWHGTGNLSLKTVYSGFATVEADGGIHRIEPSTYVVINHQREYAIEFNDEAGVEGLSLYFDPRMVSQTLESYRHGIDRNLESPNLFASKTSEFFERICERDLVLDQIDKIHADLPMLGGDSLWVQESLQLTLNLLIERQAEIMLEVDDVQAVRSNTKEELYRRLYKARDYAYATLDQSVSLDDLAYVACLSTNYFLRSFRGLFGQTPHQFIIDRRMERAQQLLLGSGQSVSEICSAVGFQSLGSFSWLFKRRIGLSPEAYRRNGSHPLPIP